MLESIIEKVAGISIECICDDGKKRIIHYKFNEPTDKVRLEQGVNRIKAMRQDNDKKVKQWNLPPYDIKINIECDDFDIVIAEI